MGEYHPAQRKVVVQFSPADLKLSPVQADKLRKLAGPRYNPETDTVKMSSDKYEHQAQNKRYLSDLVDTLIEAAKVSKQQSHSFPLSHSGHLNDMGWMPRRSGRLTEGHHDRIPKTRSRTSRSTRGTTSSRTSPNSPRSGA